MVSPEADPPGLDLVAVTAWLDELKPGLRHGPLHASVIAGGRSNLTYRLTDGVTDWALRRPPLGHVLPTAHDMTREFTVISALHGTAVAVPEPVALCSDSSVLDQPFYLMSFVDGLIVEQPALVPDPATAQRTTELLVDTLVALHRLDPAAVGLEQFGKPEGFLQRQVARWHKQFQSSVPDGDAVEQSVVDRLQQHFPDNPRHGIVHGDYRLTNVLYQKDFSRIAAVVDWEMATLGDPLTDIGLLYVYHERAGAADERSREEADGPVSVMANFPASQGFLTPEQMLQRYADQTGQSLDELDWYIAFGYFKLAVIAAGIHARFLQGKTVGVGFDIFGHLRDSTLAAADARLHTMSQ